MRINRYLARCGLGSRRAVEQLILEGRVWLDGAQIFDLAARVHPGTVVEVDGARQRLPARRTILLFHKPPLTLCTASDPEGRRTIYDHLPPEMKNLRYVGRLDWETRGLLLLTDDGELARRLTHPRWQIPRLYRARLSRPLTNSEAHILMNGVELPPEPGYRSGAVQTSPCEIRTRDNEAELLLQEGKNREVRRMMALFGIEVVELIRLGYGLVELGELAEGAWREATAAEQAVLLGSVDFDEDGQ